ncbi:ABC-2 type transport system permease protein [Bifidobacterium bohemicum]|uniref:ABC-2 type transporter n=1 Tax=Bifidobacterium bohemicum DSM 22767 TaxID=1437606 RepID=A0A086ZFK3_9BIFI|nr:ABC transporter permease [Bifidobacterium bohemicum]KFI45303.1 ABC-2 type transporter [Bifidobacterium bohemicum DSM 22767]SCC20101.1 ABC-2 type transport system permease protein [Bifidobacterium bohemicum]
MAWLYRVNNIAQVSKTSSMLLANAGTTIVSIFLTPLLDILFSVLIGASLGSKNLVRIALAGVVVQIVITVSTVICTSVAYDKEQDVIQEVFSRRWIDLTYWTGTSIPGICAGVTTGLVSSCSILALDSSHDLHQFFHTILVFPAALVAGISLGILASGIGLIMSDSFAAVNVITAIAPITSGAIIPLRYYPSILQGVFRNLPLSAAVKAIITGGSDLTALLCELETGLICMALGFLATRCTMRRLRNGISTKMN